MAGSRQKTTLSNMKGIVGRNNQQQTTSKRRDGRPNIGLNRGSIGLRHHSAEKAYRTADGCRADPFSVFLLAPAIRASQRRK
jgi:hypothetical protein